MNYQPLSPFIYKTIWSFFFNKVGKDIYKEIKNISLDYVDTSNYKFGINIVFMSVLLQNIIAKWRSGTIDYYLSTLTLFKRLGHISDAQIRDIKENIRQYDCGTFSIDSAFDLIDLSIKNKSINVSFYYFALSQTILCKIFNRLAIFNHDLFKILSSIKNTDIRRIVVRTIINNQLFGVQQDLKEDIILFCLSSKSELENNGVKHLLIFGSINDNQYHDNSDIDMSVDCDEKYDFKNIKSLLSFNLFKAFKRNSDLHLFSEKKDIIEKVDAYLIF